MVAVSNSCYRRYPCVCASLLSVVSWIEGIQIIQAFINTTFHFKNFFLCRVELFGLVEAM